MVVTHRYDLEFLEEGNTIAMGVSFQSMRHLDLAEVASNSQVITDGDRGEGSPNARADQSRERCTTAESWDEHNDSERDDSRQHAFEVNRCYARTNRANTTPRAWHGVALFYSSGRSLAHVPRCGQNRPIYQPLTPIPPWAARPIECARFPTYCPQTGERIMLQETGTRTWREATIGEHRSRGRYDVKLCDGSVVRGVEPSRIR